MTGPRRRSVEPPLTGTQNEMGTLPRNRLGQRNRSGNRGQKESSGRGWRGALAVLVGGLVVLIVVVVLLPPLAGGLMRSMAEENPDLIRLPFFADAVRDNLDDRLDRPAGTDATPVEFDIPLGTGQREITDQLVERELVTDRLAFAWALMTDDAGSRLQAGTHVLNRTMSPRLVAEALQLPALPVAERTTIALRAGLRIEQVVAYLGDNRDSIAFDPADFYELANEPPADVLANYSMLATKPAGRSLEGYLGSGVFQMEKDTNARQFLDILLERRQAELEPLLSLTAPAPLANFYEVLTMASIVEAETNLGEERPLVAGVYLNRLDPGQWPTRLLNADPTVEYGNDTVNIRAMSIEEWKGYFFWRVPGRPMAEVSLPGDLAGFQTYRERGLPPGPIRSPSVAAIQGVLTPDTSDGFLYFVAKGDGGHAFAKTWEEHLANIRLYQGGGEPTPSPSPTP